MLFYVDGSNISSSEIINVASGEGQIPVYFTLEPNWEALAFVHARLKCDDRFATNLQNIFHALDCIKRSVVAISARFAERKEFQSEINVGQLVNRGNVRGMISDDQIFSCFKKIRGTPQYFCDMPVDVLSKIMQFGVHTFVLTCSVAEFHWTEMIQVVAPQYGETLTNEQVNAMGWSTTVNYLKRNPVTVARQIDYVFKQLCGNVILSVILPTGKILNFEEPNGVPK